LKKIIDGNVNSDKIRDEWKEINERYKRLKSRRRKKVSESISKNSRI